MDETPPQPQRYILRSAFWWLRWVPAAVITALVLYFLYVAGSVAVVPVLASIALAYVLNPIVRQFERYGFSRAPASLAAIILVSLAIAAFLAYVVPDLWAESSKAGARIVQSFTPENAVRQRAVLRRYSPALERVAGDRIERFLSDPVAFYNENISTKSAQLDDEGNVVTTPGGSVVLSTIISSKDTPETACTVRSIAG